MLAAATGDLAVVVTVVATLAVAVLLASARSAVVAARRLRRSAEALERQVQEVLRSVDGTLAHASAEIERMDDLIVSAEQLTGSVGSASRLAYTSVVSPLIKVMAFSRGTARASRRLRQGGSRTQSRRR